MKNLSDVAESICGAAVLIVFILAMAGYFSK